jgi:hypothetical protein
VITVGASPSNGSSSSGSLTLPDSARDGDHLLPAPGEIVRRCGRDIDAPLAALPELCAKSRAPGGPARNACSPPARAWRARPRATTIGPASCSSAGGR